MRMQRGKRKDQGVMYSPCRITAEAKKFGMKAGLAMDLMTGWDFKEKRGQGSGNEVRGRGKAVSPDRQSNVHYVQRAAEPQPVDRGEAETMGGSAGAHQVRGKVVQEADDRREVVLA